MPVLFLLNVPKMGRHVAPINVKFGTGKRTAGPLPRAKFHVYLGENVGMPPKLSKFRILARNLYLRATRLQYFYEILSICTRLQVAFKFLVLSFSGDKQPSYKHFPLGGGIFPQITNSSAAKLLIGSKKLGEGCKNGTDLLYHHAKYGGDRGSRAGYRRTSVI